MFPNSVNDLRREMIVEVEKSLIVKKIAQRNETQEPRRRSLR